MKKLGYMVAMVLFLAVSSVSAAEITADKLKLTEAQNKKLIELKENLNAEVQPIWEEVESGRNRIMEIEKRYFEEFWNILTDEQKKEFAKLNES